MSDDHFGDIPIPVVMDEWDKGWRDRGAHDSVWGDAHVEIPRSNVLGACILVLYGVIVGIAILALVQW